MKKVGFIGVGNIGMGMAKSILREGFDIIIKTGKDYDVPLFTTAAACEMAKAAKAIAPEEDLGAIVKPLEKITGVEVKKTT